VKKIPVPFRFANWIFRKERDETASSISSEYSTHTIYRTCQDEVKAERDWGKEVRSDTERFFETTFKASPSPLSDDWHAEGESREYQV
jgi:hypothetical protein